ncbi:MAG: ATP/GTP-binding protein [Candidatus Bathyarchaeota archaeon]
MQILFIGTAGSGKSSLTATFGKWINQNMRASVGYVNLDPGCIFTPFKPDYDIRDFFTVKQIMSKEKLGPNGAMVRSAELMEENVQEIADKIQQIQADFILIDTPGQMEIFVLRKAGPKIASGIKKYGRPIAISVLDPYLGDTATGLSVAASLSVIAQLRLDIPAVTILNKIDTVDKKKMSGLLSDFELLRSSVISEREGAMSDLALHFSDILKDLSKVSGTVMVSAKTGYGMERLYDLCHEVFCACGET